jgi:hypothetical protein
MHPAAEAETQRRTRAMEVTIQHPAVETAEATTQRRTRATEVTIQHPEAETAEATTPTVPAPTPARHRL